MSAANIWLVIKALLLIVPPIIEMVRNGQIRATSQQEVLDALSANLQARFDAARAAADGDTDELSDINNRAAPVNQQHDGGTTLP